MPAPTRRWFVLLFALAAASVAAAPKFTSVWKASDVSHLSLAGKKVGALVMTADQSLQMSGEEALARELTSRGAEGVASYRLIPREELQNAEKARGWFERAAVEGVVALRPVSMDTRAASPVVWSAPYYQTFYGYYGYGWGAVYAPQSGRDTTTVVVETLIFSVKQDRLLWAATSETRDPKQLQSFVGDLVAAAAAEMKKMKLIG